MSARACVAGGAGDGCLESGRIRCLITAGPTREYFDPVRFISNPSSGKMGYALAQAALERGWAVELVSGPVALTPPEGAVVTPVVTGAELLEAVRARFPQCDVLLMCAAVCDMRPVERSAQKVKKDALGMTVTFEPVADVLKTVAAGKRPGQCVCGFAAETDDVEAHARQKLEAKNLDAIAANHVGGADNAFEADSNRIVLLGRDGSRHVLGPGPKLDVARAMLAALPVAKPG